MANFTGCVNGIDYCDPMEFNTSTFGARYEYSKTLVPGFGCYLNMNRTVNGSWGLVEITQASTNNDNTSLLLFDKDDNTTQFDAVNDIIGLERKGLVYSDDGWLPKQLFIVNRDMRNFATFTYVYETATKLSITIVSATSLVLLALS